MPANLEALLTDSEIRASLSDAHYIAAISRQITERPRTRLDGSYSEGLTPSQLLERYLDSRDTPPDRAKDLLQRGAQLIVEAQPGMNPSRIGHKLTYSRIPSLLWPRALPKRGPAERECT